MSNISNLFNYDNDVIQINACKHIFYEKYTKWFQINNKCPVCRYNIKSNIN